LLQEFNDWFRQVQGSRKMPKGEELFDYMCKKYGQPSTIKGWVGLEFVREEDDNEDAMENI
jgi:hypothetical protein